MPGFRAEKDVVSGRQPGEKHGALEQHPAVGAGPTNHLAAHDHPPLVVGEDAGDDVQQCRLTASRGPEQADELTLIDLQVDVSQRFKVPTMTPEDLADALDGDQGRTIGPVFGLRPDHGPRAGLGPGTEPL